MVEDQVINIKTKLKKIKIGIVSDTHFCCKYQQLSYVNKAYQDFHDKGITTVLHIGDMVDGDYRNRPDHIYSLFKIGASEQAEYIINNYPKVKGIRTYFIQGSHDATHIKNGGADIGRMIQQGRDDMFNLGICKANIIINKCDIQLLHPGGGSSYAFSYKPQKIVDSMMGGDKPNVLLIGHHHKNLYMMYRKIHILQVPSLEATTPFMTSMGLINDMGYDIIELYVDEIGNVQRFNVEYIPFYNTIKDDYKKARQLVIK
jgi:predicted phosphodiesterase